jgi:tetratricopeptide (TPR) repeat protein
VSPRSRDLPWTPRRTRPRGWRLPASLLVGALVCLLAPAPASAADLDDALERAERQISLLEGKAALVGHELQRTTGRRTSVEVFESRLNDGQALMLLKDYVQASLIFLELVDNEANSDQPGFADALYNLGEALFFNKNFIDARHFYRRVLEESRGKSYRRLALVRLMQIALRTNDFESLDGYRARLISEAEGTSPEGEYLWGRTLMARGRLDEAMRAFAAVVPGQPFHLQALYLSGVCLIRQGKLESALAIFDRLVQVEPRDSAQRELVELGHLARGRLQHDLGRPLDALDAYQAIEHTSIYFDDALLETCWTFIQLAEKAENPEKRNSWFLEAFRAVELLELSTQDAALVPRANLMKAHLDEKMGKFEEASEMFEKISSTYSEVKKALDSQVSSHEDPVRYFNEVAGKNLESFDLSSYLPPLAVRWMSRNDEMAAALSVMRDLDAGRRYVQESRALLKSLDDLLASQSDRVNLFTVLREGAKRLFEVENARTLLERSLAQMEQEIIEAHVSVEERQALTQAREAREALEAKLDGLPTTRRAMESREARIRARIEALEVSVFQSGIHLKGMKAQLTAMEEWLRQNEREFRGREEAVRDFREEIRRGWAMANQLQGELDGLAAQLESERTRAGMDAGALAQEEALRKQFDETCARERQLAEQIHGRLGQEGAAQIERVQAIRLRTEKLRRDGGQLRRDLDARVDIEADNLRAQADRERKNVDDYAAALDRLEQESQGLAGEVAFRALEEVRHKFYQIVLEADVGVLDVAWGRKQRVTDNIADLNKKQSAERKRLYDEFKGVLGEVE